MLVKIIDGEICNSAESVEAAAHTCVHVHIFPFFFSACGTSCSRNSAEGFFLPPGGES